MKHLTKEQRYVISVLNKRGESLQSIADEIGVHKSTISRELKRNSSKRGTYNPLKAQEFANERKERFASKRRFTKEIEKRVQSFLEKEQWSPDEIVGYCRKNKLECVSVERIYQFIRRDKAQGGNLYKHLRHQLKHRKRPVGGYSKVRIKDRVSIAHRPEFGHWEADLISGKNHKGFMLTLTERVSKQLMTSYLPEGKNAKAVANAIIDILLPYKEFVLSITMDNGLEFAEHKKVAEKLQAKTYFTNPYSSWEKGQIEYMNKLLRQYYPKNKPINNENTKNINEIQRKINNRPRKNLNYNKPFEIFYKFVNRKVAFAS